MASSSDEDIILPDVDEGKYPTANYTLPEWRLLSWVLVYLAAITSTLVWFSVLLIWENNWDDHDSKVYVSYLPYKVHYMLLFLAFASLFVIYLLALGAWSVFRFSKGGTLSELAINTVGHKVGMITSLIVSIGWFILYQYMWRSEFKMLYRSSQTCVPIIQIILCLSSVPMSYFVCYWAQKREKMIVLKIATVVIFYIFIFSVPWWYDSAHVIDGELPPRPLIIGHRGTPSERPENTLASFQNAMDISVDVVESDIAISKDGVPFIIHDPILDRTTNVAEVFPERARASVTSFMASEIVQLDAGSWFEDGNWKQKVPFLKDAINLLKGTRFKFFADVRTAPDGHPYAGQEEAIVLNLIEEMDFGNQVMWLVTNKTSVLELRERFPKMVLNSALTTLQDITSGYLDLVNHEWSESNAFIRSFAAYNASTAYVINTDWLFDQMWCLGARHVTTNRARHYLNTTTPTWWLRRTTYYALAGSVEILCAVGIAVVALFFHRRTLLHYRPVQL